MKFVLLLLLAALVWWLIRRAGRAPAPPPSPTSPQKPPPAHEPMVACAHCQVHVPQGEAHWQGGLAFCGESHRLAFLEAHPPS
jgi:uncharacterized protein